MASNRDYKSMLTALGLNVKQRRKKEQLQPEKPERFNYCEGLQKEIYTRKPNQLNNVVDFDNWVRQLQAFQAEKNVSDFCMAAINGVIRYISDYATPCSIASRSRAASTKRIKDMNAVIETCTNKYETDSDKYRKIKFKFDQMERGFFGGSKLRDYVYNAVSPIIAKASEEPQSVCPFVLC